MNIIAPILDSGSQTVTYYDPNKNTDVTMSTYTGDWNYQASRISNKIDSSFEISFISKEKRG